MTLVVKEPFTDPHDAHAYVKGEEITDSDTVTHVLANFPEHVIKRADLS